MQCVRWIQSKIPVYTDSPAFNLGKINLRLILRLFKANNNWPYINVYTCIWMSEGGMKEVCEFIYNQNDVLHACTFVYCKFTTHI